jgi:antitoxin component YwqK of YwqJK toxin-antitoxin module
MKRLTKVAVIVSGILALSYLVTFLYYWPFYKQFHTVWIVTDVKGTSEKLFSGGPPFSYDSDAWDRIRERRISGLIQVYQKQTGALKMEFSVKNGKRHGTTKEFFMRSDVDQDSTRGVFEEVGKVALSEIEYRDGKIHGLYIERYQNGMLGGLRSYTNDVEEGVDLMFCDDGRLASICNKKGQQLVGISKEWDAEGNLVENTFYDDCMNSTTGFLRVGYDGRGKREVYDVVKRQTMTVEDFQKTLTDEEKYQPKIRELPKFFSLDPKIIAILDKECSAHTNSHPSESSSQSK